MNIVDVHCHLDLYKGWDKEFDVDVFLEMQKKYDVKVIISNGVTPESNRKVLALAKKYPIVKAALGFYPTHVLEFSDEDFEKELKFIEKNKEHIVAIGEIGLDKHHVEDKLSEMQKAFEKIVLLAKKIDKPILVHSRKAELETIECLERLGHKKIVMHCFGGRKQHIKRIIENGWYFSIPTTVVKLQQFQEIIKECPFEKILTETDGPYLSPFKDGKPNESRFIVESLKKIAEIKGLDVEEVSNMIFMNYQRLFL